MYDTRFSIHFSPTSSSGEDEEEQEMEQEGTVRRAEVNGGGYEPTIVCYNKHDSIMEVRTDNQLVRGTDILYISSLSCSCIVGMQRTSSGVCH